MLDILSQLGLTRSGLAGDTKKPQRNVLLEIQQPTNPAPGDWGYGV
jgi:hypothetical protein